MSGTNIKIHKVVLLSMTGEVRWVSAFGLSNNEHLYSPKAEIQFMRYDIKYNTVQNEVK